MCVCLTHTHTSLYRVICVVCLLTVLCQRCVSLSKLRIKHRRVCVSACCLMTRSISRAGVSLLRTIAVHPELRAAEGALAVAGLLNQVCDREAVAYSGVLCDRRGVREARLLPRQVSELCCWETEPPGDAVSDSVQ